jgi:hemerythrin-like domain-containing protein
VIDAEETFHAYHRELLARLHAALEELENDGDVSADAGLARLSGLADDFVRYVEANGGSLYPAVAPLVLSYREVMAPMLLDIRAIDDLVAESEEIALEELNSSDEGRRSRRRRIERLAAQFDAVIRLHFDKLERIYLPMLAEVPADERRAVLDHMAEEYEPRPVWPERAATGT